MVLQFLQLYIGAFLMTHTLETVDLGSLIKFLPFKPIEINNSPCNIETLAEHLANNNDLEFYILKHSPKTLNTIGKCGPYEFSFNQKVEEIKQCHKMSYDSTTYSFNDHYYFRITKFQGGEEYKSYLSAALTKLFDDLDQIGIKPELTGIPVYGYFVE